MSRAGFCNTVRRVAGGARRRSGQCTGDWDMTIESPQGTNTVKVTLTQDGEKVSGLFKSEMGELPFTGTLVGVDLKFGFAIPIQGQSLDIVVTGKVDGATLAGKMQFGGFGEGDWTAKRAPAAGCHDDRIACDDDVDDDSVDHDGAGCRRQRGRQSGTSPSKRRTAISRPW